MKRKLLPLFISLASSSALALEGKIIDTEGAAIAGAKVDAVGKRASAETDENGLFKLDVSEVHELHISAPGFSHKVVHVENEDELQNIVLAESVIEQVDVIGIPLHGSIIESAMPIAVLTGEELRKKQASTLGDTLATEIGVHTNFHGKVASTPVIRGLSGPRVLITQNSLDVSDVSRVGPDHSVATEVSTAEQLEILRGPATLFFGSGAIGGVVNVVDKRVPTDTSTFGEFLIAHDTVNEQNETAFSVNAGAGDFAFHADGFWRESSDYEVPVAPELEEEHEEHEEEHEGEEHAEEEHDHEHGNERVVEGTAEESSGFTLGASYILENGFVGVSYGRLERDYGIPGHSHDEEEEEHHDDETDTDLDLDADHDEDHEEEEVTLGLEQDRFQLISELNLNHSFFSEFNTRIGYTDYSHTEFENGEVGTTFSNETTELRTELLHQELSGWHGGFVFHYKNSEFSAQGEEAFAPPSSTDTFALALLEEKHFGDVLVQLGARIENVSVSSDEVTISDVEFHMHDEEEHSEEEEAHEEGEHEDEIFSFDENYNPFSISAGAVWDFAPGYNVGVSLSHSQRAPSAAELLSFGPHIATGTFEVGALFESHMEEDEIHFERVEATPEMEVSNNIDLSFRKYEGDLGIILNVFYNQVDNYYAQYDTELYAEFSHEHEEEEETTEEEAHADEHADELPVIAFASADASLYGFEAQGLWQISENLKTTVFSDYVRAELDDGGNLPRIPPLRFGLGFDYELENISANLGWTHYADQDNVAELETETEGYNWIDASVNYRISLGKTDLTLFVKGENLGDEEARVHSSFLKSEAPRPGRNFKVGLRGSF